MGRLKAIYKTESVPMRIFELSQAIMAARQNDYVEYILTSHDDYAFRVHVETSNEDKKGVVCLWIEVWLYLLLEGDVDIDQLERRIQLLRWLKDRGYWMGNTFEGVAECQITIAEAIDYSSASGIVSIEKVLKQEYKAVMKKIKETGRKKSTAMKSSIPKESPEEAERKV